MADPASSPETRTTLLRGVCRHDPASWTEFVQLYDPLLCAYLRSLDQKLQLGLDDADYEDAKQEVLIKLHHHLPKFDPTQRFRTWLWTVTRNALLDWLRQQRGRRGAATGAKATGRPRRIAWTPELQDSLADAGAAPPDRQLIAAHDVQLLRHVMDLVKTELTSAHKWDCFEMHYLQGQPSAAVAQALGLSVSLVNTNTSRVRARIRELCQYYDIDL